MATSDVDLQSRQRAIAGDPLPYHSSLYQVRSEDEAKASQTVLEPGALVRIRGSHGMGKTSLINQLLHQAAEANCKTTYLSLTALDPTACADLDSFLHEFCLQVTRALAIPDQLDEYWDDFFGSTICCKSYFEEYLLPEIAGPWVLALDDVDRVFTLQNVADDFFGLLRAWHEEAKTRELWQQLRLIVAHSTDLYVPQNINKSPFNVGLPIELGPLQPAQVQPLLDQWQLPLSETEVSTLTQFVGGRPNLLQIACHALATTGGDLATTLQNALSPGSPFSGSLQRLQRALDGQPHLNEILTAATAGEPLESLSAKDLYHLDSLGVIGVADQKAAFSCGLYAQWYANR